MNDSSKKVAIITGGASGIGRALCKELAGAATLIIVADVNVDGAKRVAADINGNGGQALAEALDGGIAAQDGGARTGGANHP
ncbi:MAG: SDR family NAD(P)-dependent oxidoreductase [Desulfobacterales bacterium]|jgi:NAD(P)-dependent dehydrogenase (short-subunit alcohol dehydrogenase family)